MAEITLGDLLTWEPRLRLVPVAGAGDSRTAPAGAVAEPVSTIVPPAVEEREVSWAVAARATPPMLPPLRGGEVVLLAHRLLRESGISLGPLLRELAGHGVAAVVTEAETLPPGVRAGMPLPILVLSVGPLTAELETDLNRLLTQKRGELYRAGTDFGRLLAGLTTIGAEPARIVAAAAEHVKVAVEVLDGEGRRLAAAGLPPAASPPGRSGERLAVPLAGGETLWLGPLPGERRALARLAGERIGVAVEAALTRSARLRPRGPARAAALAAWLESPPEDAAGQAALAASLGLVPSAAYRVALGAPSLAEGELQRRLAPFGIVHDAARIDGLPAALVDSRGEAGAAGAGRAPTVGKGNGRDRGRWVAVSGAAPDVGGLAEGLRQARFVAALLRAGMVPGPVARFDRPAEIGVYRLLYDHWGRPELRSFADAALGDLAVRDRRGVLRQTLLAYLEAGGSHVEAAARLAVHRNTLAYRLKQVAGLTGADPSDPANRLLLHLALLAAALPPAPEP